MTGMAKAGEFHESMGLSRLGRSGLPLLPNSFHCAKQQDQGSFLADKVVHI